MAVNKKYAKEIHEQFSYLATWLPTAHIGVGDVGVVEKSIFTRMGTLQDFKIPFKTREGFRRSRFGIQRRRAPSKSMPLEEAMHRCQVRRP